MEGGDGKWVLNTWSYHPGGGPDHRGGAGLPRRDHRVDRPPGQGLYLNRHVPAEGGVIYRDWYLEEMGKMSSCISLGISFL